MESWPAILPEPLAEAYNGEVTPAVIRTNMDSGYPRQRKRFTQELKSFGITFSFDSDQFAIFQAWCKFKISAGADWFTMSWDIGGDKSSRNVRFSGPYSFQYRGGRWIVKSTIETLNTETMSEAELNAALA